MASGEILPNILAMISSFGAMILLGMVIPRIGGSLGKMLKLLIVGIFFAVFIHAAAELARLYGIIGDDVLMPMMGMLLTIGSVFFAVGGFVGLKALK